MQPEVRVSREGGEGFLLCQKLDFENFIVKYEIDANTSEKHLPFKELIILFLLSSDFSQVFQPYSFKTRRNSTTIMNSRTFVSINVNIQSDFGS